MFMIPTAILFMSPGPARDYMEWLWNTYRSLMFAVARKTSRESNKQADIEDIVSDSTVRLCENVETLQRLNEYQLRAYIVKTVWTTAIKYNRKKYGAPTIDIELIDLFDNQNNEWENRIQLQEELTFVLSCIQKLPAKERAVIKLKFKTDLSTEEIAEIVGLSKNSVRQYMKRARDRLVKMVYDYEATSGDSNE